MSATASLHSVTYPTLDAGRDQQLGRSPPAPLGRLVLPTRLCRLASYRRLHGAHVRNQRQPPRLDL
jgi:hypothetical protein